MRTPTTLIVATCLPALFLAACETPSSDPCRAGAFANAGSLAVVSSPAPGDTFPSGSTVRGCGRAFESTLQYKLTSKNGGTLASGFTKTGGVDGAAPFSFTVAYTVSEAQLGHLEVFEEDVSDGEGFPPSRSVIPVLLSP